MLELDVHSKLWGLGFEIFEDLKYIVARCGALHCWNEVVEMCWRFSVRTCSVANFNLLDRSASMIWFCNLTAC